uniref:Uncharacterized protein n=1 Tax=Geobacter metallireducens TaxID=28232 RepID=A0A831U2N1_GEOME
MAFAHFLEKLDAVDSLHVDPAHPRPVVPGKADGQVVGGLFGEIASIIGDDGNPGSLAMPLADVDKGAGGEPRLGGALLDESVLHGGCVGSAGRQNGLSLIPNWSSRWR